MNERIAYQEIPADIFTHMRNLEDYLNQGPIAYKLLELIRLRVAQIQQCAYCLDMHTKELLHAGETDVRIATLPAWRECHYYTEREKVALALAECLNDNKTNIVSDELFEELLVNYSKEEISYLTLVIAQINSWTTLMKTFKFVPGNYKVTK